MFAVEVPYGDATQQVAAPIAMIHGAINCLNGMRVAVVDDEIDILEATTELLERWGCEVLAARSEAEILEALRSASATPDFLICDYQLPDGEDGLSVIRNARRAYGTAIPAVVILGNACPELRTATREAGITLLLKPVAPPRLRQVMQRLLSG